MQSSKLLKGLDVRRFRLLLAALFLTLAVPTATLIWQAYGQLKWEAYYQYRGLAEELSRRIDDRLVEQVNSAEARASSDYAFLVVSGDPAANLLQRSPLSAYPVAEDIPGLIGYFQVDGDGAFSTPLLPTEEAGAEKLGISPGELEGRRQVANVIETVLGENSLVRERTRAGRSVGLDALEQQGSLARKAGLDESVSAAADAPGFADGKEKKPAAVAVYPLDGPEESSRQDYSQQVFDRLNNAASPAISDEGAIEAEVPENRAESSEKQRVYSKVADLKLDASLQKKSELFEREQPVAQAPATQGTALVGARDRARREEQSALPEAGSPAQFVDADGRSGSVGAMRITSFASEVDPFEFSLLDSGHLVLYRKVWRDGERLIQGMLIDQSAFIRDAVEGVFRASLLSSMSDLVVGYQDDVIRVVHGGELVTHSQPAADLQGTLLYRNRLSAPLADLELIFSINRLPPGPGADVLRWITLVIAMVFIGGFYLLYFLGLGQIKLARQQQDFVSAVSHELKTPLTSIRMYSEMLQEGWVDDDKRKQYYQYINTESERLTRLISNVLRLANITRNEPSLDLKPRTVAELLQQVESKTASQLAQAGFVLEPIRDERVDACRVNVDEDCFVQIIINLVDNAIKFSRKAGNKTIEIGCRRAGHDQLAFTVRDYGPGIARNQLKKIFRLFYRSESELTRETVGTGIGLAIVHQLTLAMKGKVDVINREPGVEFRVTLPEFRSQGLEP